MSQSGYLAAGTYSLSFQAAQRAANQGGQTIQVLIDGAVAGSITPSGTGYVPCSVAFTISALGLHQLTLAGLNPKGGDNTALVDQVSVSPISTIPANNSGFESHLIIPAAVAQGNSRTISVEYSNQGTTPITAPLLMIGPSTPNANELFTLNSSLANSTSSQGYSGYAEILASGRVAGVLDPGESITVPVYFYSNAVPASNLTFGLWSYNQANTSAVGWSSLQASLAAVGHVNNGLERTFHGLHGPSREHLGQLCPDARQQCVLLGTVGRKCHRRRPTLAVRFGAGRRANAHPTIVVGHGPRPRDARA